MIHPSQIRAARGMLDISQTELAQLSEVSLATIKKIENSSEEPRVTVPILLRVQRALEQAGIVFIDEDSEHGLGVMLRQARARSELRARPSYQRRKHP
jgi:predicted transcriptional regulator